MKSKLLSRISDKKLGKLGFSKVHESPVVIEYERNNVVYNHMHTVDIGHKANGRNVIISYVSGEANTSKEYNDSVGLTGVETKWFLIKMISIGWYSKKPSWYMNAKKGR